MAELHSNLFPRLCGMENPSVTIMNEFVSIHNFVRRQRVVAESWFCFVFIFSKDNDKDPTHGCDCKINCVSCCMGVIGQRILPYRQ